MGPRLVRRGRIWHAWVPAPGGGVHRVTTNCTDKKAAKVRAVELERLAASPGDAAADQTTVAELVARFLASRRRAGRAEDTLKFYKTKCGHLIRLLPQYAKHITMDVVERYTDTREGEGARGSVKKELRALGTMLRYAVRAGLWVGDVRAVLPEYKDPYEPGKRSLTFDEVKALLIALERPDNAQDSTRARNRAAFVAFAIATGARLGETLRAQREDVTDRAVFIRGTKTKAARREVPLLGFSRELMDYVLSAAEPEGLLFHRWSNPVRDLAVACRQAGIPRVTPNDLRRTYASWMLAAGLDLDTTRRLMGHTSTRMLERVYGQVSSAQLAERVGARLGGEVKGLLPEGKK